MQEQTATAVAKATAVTGTAGAIGLAALMWTADHLHWNIPEPVYYLVAAISTFLIVWSVVLWAKIAILHFRARKPRLTPSLLLVIGTIGATLSMSLIIVALVWQWREGKGAFVDLTDAVASYESGPIEWHFSKPESFLGTSMRAGGPLWIDAIHITGTNRKDFPLTNVSATIIPEISPGERFQLKFAIDGRQIDPKDTYGIPSGTDFTLIHVFPSIDKNYSQGISANDFLTRYGGFQFIFFYNGVQFSKNFSFSEVRDEIQRLEKENKALVTPKPKIQIRSN